MTTENTPDPYGTSDAPAASAASAASPAAPSPASSPLSATAVPTPSRWRRIRSWRVPAVAAAGALVIGLLAGTGGGILLGKVASHDRGPGGSSEHADAQDGRRFGPTIGDREAGPAGGDRHGDRPLPGEPGTGPHRDADTAPGSPDAQPEPAAPAA